MSKINLLYNYCFDDAYNEDGRCVYTLYNGEQVQLEEKCSFYTTKQDCTDSSKLNLTINDYHLMMGLSANFLAFSMIFLVGFLFVLQGRR